MNAAAPRVRKRSARLRFFDRSTGDIIVLLIAFTVCFVVMFTTVSIVAMRFYSPDVSIDQAVRTVTGLTNTLIGLLAGFLAGRSTILRQQQVPLPVKEKGDE